MGYIFTVMNKKISVFAALALFGGLAIASAENPDKKPPMPPKEGSGGEGRMRDKMREKFLENLPPDIRQRFEAAREKALQDPKIQELRKEADRANGEFFKAMREKMMELDPGLAEIVKKQAMEGGKGWKDRKGPGGPPGMGSLSEDEHKKLMAAREKAKADPSVQAAEKKKESAQSPEDRKTASEEYRKTMHEAILRADPSVAPLLEKMAPKPPPPAPPGPGGDGEMMQPQG